MVNFEIENCYKNIGFYKEQIRKMQEKITKLKKINDGSEDSTDRLMHDYFCAF